MFCAVNKIHTHLCLSGSLWKFPFVLKKSFKKVKREDTDIKREQVVYITI